MEEMEYSFKPKTDNEKAREYFKPLTYADISKSDWRMLIAILEKHIEKRNVEQAEVKKANNGFSDYTYEIDKCIWNKETKRRKFSAYIHVKLDGFSVREGISFNPDGFIGFAGWASSYNTKLFTDAFCEWVDWKKGQNQNIVLQETGFKGMIMNKKQYEDFKKSYYVNDLPENPEIGRICKMNGKEYIYTTDEKWVNIVDPVVKLEQVSDIVKDMPKGEYKDKLLEVLCL